MGLSLCVYTVCVDTHSYYMASDPYDQDTNVDLKLIMIAVLRRLYFMYNWDIFFLSLQA